MAPTPTGTKRADSPPWLKVAGLAAPLTAAERRVLAALADGSVADIHSGGKRCSVRAGLIRAIVTGLAIPVEQIDPRGLQLVGAAIAERIDLDDVRFARPLRLIYCELAAGLSAGRAELHSLDLMGCTINPSGIGGATDDVPTLMLDELRVTHGVSFARSEVTGAVRLAVANIGGQLDFVGGTFANDSGPALIADQITTTGSVVLAGIFTGDGPLGAARLPGATIGGQLHCMEGAFTNDTGPALHADNLTTTNNVNLAGTFAGNGADGAIRLLGAHIGGQLDFVSGAFTNGSGPALYADNLTTTSNVYMAGTFTGKGTDGTIRLLGAHIGGQLHCTKGTFTNYTGPALTADGLTTTGDIELAGNFTGDSPDGAVRLASASIGGQLNCTGATLCNDTGPALHAENLTTTNNVILAGTFTSSSPHGAVLLMVANIGGQLHCTKGTFTNSIGPALTADGITTTSNVNLGGTFTGNSKLGIVRLPGASIGGQLHCIDGSLRSRQPGALRLYGAKVHGAWVLDPAFLATDTPGEWLSMDGFAYVGTPIGVGAAKQFGALEWARLLSTQTLQYAAQPYQQLAGVYRAAGHEQDAKAVLMAQQDDRSKRVVKAEGHRWRGFAMRLSKLFTGYGYQSSRALWWLLGLTGASILLSFCASNVAIDGNADPAGPAQWTTVLAHKPTKTDAGAPCSFVELVGVGISWAVPIVDTNVSARCVLNSTHPYGQWWTGVSWLLHIIGWAFATLAVAGYTGLIRKL